MLHVAAATCDHRKEPKETQCRKTKKRTRIHVKDSGYYESLPRHTWAVAERLAEQKTAVSYGLIGRDGQI